MGTLRTNRDLYLAITDLIERQSTNLRSLDEYLRALHTLAMGLKSEAHIPLTLFVDLLSQSFAERPTEYDASWTARYNDESNELNGYPAWESRLIRQVIDLRELTAIGKPSDPWDFTGCNSPRGHRWYNFTPTGYLECATEGTFGGWEPADDTGRSFVPGMVAVLDANGEMTTADPESLPRPNFDIDVISSTVSLA
jgi:hypothetical protein